MCVCVCVCACVRACVRACVHVCVCHVHALLSVMAAVQPRRRNGLAGYKANSNPPTPFVCLSLMHTYTGAIPWLMVAELFLQEARPIAVTVATIANWLSNFTVALVFPQILVSSYHS